jgi:hypothetical protein
MVPRRPLRLPASMAELLRHTRHFTEPGDVEVAVRIYADFFYSATRMVSKLNLSQRGWNADDARCLSKVLPFCKRCHTLDLSHNPLGKRGGQLVASMLSAFGCQITHVDLSGTDIDPASVRELLQLRRLKSLRIDPLNTGNSDEARLLDVSRGQMPGAHPRLQLPPFEAQRRYRQTISHDLSERYSKWVARSAHRLGWLPNKTY